MMPAQNNCPATRPSGGFFMLICTYTALTGFGLALLALLHPCNLLIILNYLVPRAGFEPATCPLGGDRAIQLSHRSIMVLGLAIW